MNNHNWDVLQNRVIRSGLCTHCGTCTALSQGQLVMQETSNGPLPTPTTDSVKLPDDVLAACPGLQIDYPALNESVFGQVPENWLIGNYQQSYIGYSEVSAVRRNGASGGVITQVLVYLLENGLIDGAVVVRQGQPRPYEAQAIIAQTVHDLLAASQSVYAPVPVNVILEEVAHFDGRLAYVGLPDQVASLRQLQALGHPAACKIEYVIGPYVGTNMYFEAIHSYLRSNRVYDVDQIEVLRYREGEWPGYLYIKLRDGREFKAEKFYYNYLIPFYITNGTLYAVDFTNELTDISVGDAWSPRYESRGQGFSVVISRTDKAETLLHAMHEAGLLALDPVPLDDALAMHGHMLDFKKRGAFIRMQWRKWLRRPSITYGYKPEKIAFSRYAVEVIISTLFALGRLRIVRRIVERIPIRVMGPLFNSLRKLWKSASKPVKRHGLRQTHYIVCPMQEVE
jgi:coenzyme F420 hydrogenase subunit beta